MKHLIFLLAISLSAQTVPIELIVNWPPHQLIVAKYGPLPKWAMFGEVVGCNRGTSGITYGEGDVIAVLRMKANLQGFSIQDAMSLVSNSQNASLWNRTKALIGSVANSAVDLKAGGLIGKGNTTGLGIVVGAGAVRIILPNLQGALNLKQVIQYSKDGLQATMLLPAGRCTIPYSVLFAVPGPSPTVAIIDQSANQADKTVIKVDVPVDR